MVFSLVWGMGGAAISLALSRVMAKMAMGVQLVNGRTGQGELDWLYQTVEKLSRKAGLPMPEVGIYDSPEVNAFATGPSKSRSLVAVSSGLLRSMSHDEVEGVLAHEVSHIQNGDMVTMTLIQGVVNAFVDLLRARHRQHRPPDGGRAHLAPGVLRHVAGARHRVRHPRHDGGGVVLPRPRIPRRRRRRCALEPRQHDRRAPAPAANKGLVDNSQPQLATLKINGGKGKGMCADGDPPAARGTHRGLEAVEVTADRRGRTCAPFLRKGTAHFPRRHT